MFRLNYVIFGIIINEVIREFLLAYICLIISVFLRVHTKHARLPAFKIENSSASEVKSVLECVGPG